MVLLSPSLRANAESYPLILLKFEIICNINTNMIKQSPSALVLSLYLFL